MQKHVRNFSPLPLVLSTVTLATLSKAGLTTFIEFGHLTAYHQLVNSYLKELVFSNISLLKKKKKEKKRKKDLSSTGSRDKN